MIELKDILQPVGTPQPDILKDKSAEILVVWKTGIKKAWLSAVWFMIQSVDIMINFVESLPNPIPGQDKKATVLAAMDKLFDTIVTPFIPLLLRPFSSRLKKFFIYTVISLTIDWIVNKYNTGHWNPDNADVKKVFNLS